jgi:hypothetical protein
MPAVVVLIVCKAVFAEPQDQNAKWTGHENFTWAIEHAQMICRREAVQMYDPAVDGSVSDKGEVVAPPAKEQPFNEQRCMRSSVMLGTNWDRSNRNSRYRFWRVACPVPVMAKRPDGSEDIISWKIPDCGSYHGTVHCEDESET